MMRRRRDERGATAIIVAITAIVLFGIAAMAVDLGNAFARQRDVQASADFAALSGANDLPGPISNSAANSSSPAVVDVAKYLNLNAPQNDGSTPCADPTSTTSANCVTPSELVDGNTSNGEVVFSDGGDKMTVYTPPARVDFGLAQVIGASHVNLVKSAEVGVYSVGATLPLYVGQVCSYGTQQILDTPPGQPNKPTSPIFNPASKNNFTVGTIAATPNTFTWDSPDSTSPQPTVTIAVDPTTVDLTQFGWVDFVNDSTSVPAQYYDVAIDPTSPLFDAAAGTVTISVPYGVLNTGGYWFIRLGKTSSNGVLQYTEDYATIYVNTTVYVGDCTGKTQGNFGSLRFERTDATNWNTVLALNTAAGLEQTVSSWPNATPPTNGCNNSIYIPPAVLTTTYVQGGNGVNCVQTDTGNATSAEWGLVTGVDDQSGTHYYGLLDTQGGTNDKVTTCGPPGSSGYAGDLSLTVKGNTYQVNNDILSCYFTDATNKTTGSPVTVADVSSAGFNLSNWSSTPLSPAIYSSPRFVVLPVLNYDATTGAQYWPIVDWRAAFITEQSTDATKSNPDGSDPLMLYDPTGVDHTETLNNSTKQYPTFNGIGWDDTKGLTTMHAVMLNWDALPKPADYNGKVVTYRGGNDQSKVIRLIG